MCPIIRATHRNADAKNRTNSVKKGTVLSCKFITDVENDLPLRPNTLEHASPYAKTKVKQKKTSYSTRPEKKYKIVAEKKRKNLKFQMLAAMYHKGDQGQYCYTLK